MARFYGWTHEQMLGMYWRAFFAYAKRVVPLQAEEDLRQLYLLRASQAEQKPFQRMVNDLRRQMGEEQSERGRRRGVDTAERLQREARGQRFIDGSIRVVADDTLAAEIEAKRRKFGAST